MNHEEAATRCYAAAAELLLALKEKEFDPADAATVLLCALGRIAAITRTPELQAWRTVTSEGCHDGFRFGYLNQAEQLNSGNVIDVS